MMLRTHCSGVIRCCLVLLYFSTNLVNAQTYQFSFKEDKGVLFSSMAIWSGIKTYDLLRNAEYIDDYEDIDPSRLWKIDRRSLQRNSSKADRLSDAFLYTSISLPFLSALLDPTMQSEATNIAWMGISGYLIESSINQIFKISTERPRPYIYQRAEAVLNQPINKNSTKSFFSGHASSAAYFTFFAAKVFADTHPDSKLKPFVWSAAALLSGTTGYLRYRAGKHFYTDVLTGLVFGAGLGILIPELYRNKRKKINLKVSLDGVALKIKI